MAIWNGISSQLSGDTGDGTFTTTTLSSASIAIGEPLTPEERQKLDNLLRDRDMWIRSEKLRNFQNLPVHIRQDIVDESCLRECLMGMDEVNEFNFDGQSEINKLEQKDKMSHYNSYRSGTQLSPNFHSYIGPVDASYEPHNIQFKYYKIINEFTKDELMEAHAAATLEESLSD